MADNVAYQALLQELQAPVQVANGPSYSPDEVRRRVAQNNQLIQLGLVGQLSGDEAAGRVGGQVFKQALADRNERQTLRGIQDPLTGETRVDPEYAAQEERQRRGQVLQQALGYESKRQAEAAANARAQENHQARMEEIRQRGEFQRTIAGMRQGGTQQGKLAPGFRWTEDGNQEIIPGGPADVKQIAANQKESLARQKRDLAIDNQITMIDRVLENVGRAEKDVGFLTTGPLGNAIAKLPGTRAYDLEQTMKTIKANLGFNELAAMRQASPTGGALGNISNKEIDSLQSTLASLEQKQSPEKLRQSLSDIRRHYNGWKAAVMKSREGSGDPGTLVPGDPAAPNPTPAPTADGRVRMVWDPATGRLVPKQ